MGQQIKNKAMESVPAGIHTPENRQTQCWDDNGFRQLLCYLQNMQVHLHYPFFQLTEFLDDKVF